MKQDACYRPVEKTPERDTPDTHKLPLSGSLSSFVHDVPSFFAFPKCCSECVRLALEKIRVDGCLRGMGVEPRVQALRPLALLPGRMGHQREVPSPKDRGRSWALEAPGTEECVILNPSAPTPAGSLPLSLPLFPSPPPWPLCLAYRTSCKGQKGK